MNTPIYNKILQLKKDGLYPLHMPGHKRMEDSFLQGVLGVDVTEIDGLDDLHHPTGIIRQTMDEFKDFYHTKETYLLVNGSSCGILAGMKTLFHRGDKVLVARNCHKSVYYGIELFELHPIYIYPNVDESGICLGITREQVAKIMEIHEDIAGVILVSPTYEGRVSDIEEISTILKDKAIKFLVDEAHGAHFVFHKDFPKSAVHLGGDIVIQSVHKTLPAMTQTALLHVCSDTVSLTDMQKNLSIFQSSSPSYVLMGSIDYGVHKCIEDTDAINEYVNVLKESRESLKKLRNLHLVHVDDIGKIVISTRDTDISGNELMEVLRKDYKIELEMAEISYVIAMTSVSDSKEELTRFVQGLIQIDQKLKQQKWEAFSYMLPKNEQVIHPSKAVKMNSHREKIEKAEELISKNYIFLYPPGIPLVVPGERIGSNCINRIMEYKKQDMNILGIEEEYIHVIDERL